MKRVWDVQRIFNERDDGQRRWDSAFQLLLQWAVTDSDLPVAETIPQQETQKNASSDLHTCIDHRPKSDPNYRTADKPFAKRD